MKTIAIDFDGVIHKYSKGWHDGTCYDVPMEGAKETLEALLEKYNVFILTTRNVNQVLEWMIEYTMLPVVIIEEDSVFWNQSNVIGITNRKLAAEVYIDDRAFRFNNWREVLENFIFHHEESNKD